MSIVLLSALLALSGGSPDPGPDEATGPAIACVDALYAEPEFAALVDRMMRQIEDERESQAAFEQLAKRAEPCGPGIAMNPRPDNLVGIYFMNRLLIRGLALRLGAAGLDLALLDRIAAEPGIGGARELDDKQAYEGLAARLRGLGFAAADAERSAGYVILVRFHRLIDSLVHPPFRRARLIGQPVGDDDYPRRALKGGVAGDTMVAIRVSAAGAVEGCDPVSSSGDARLDARACDVVRRRYRFEPAQDERGRPVAQTVYHRYKWRID